MPSYAQTVWTGAVDSDYSNTLNWSLGLPATGELATVVVSANDPVISNSLTIDYTLQLVSGTLTLDADVINNGTIAEFDAGVLVNNAILSNESGKTIIVNGLMLNNNTVNNQGTIQSSGMGTLENSVGGNFNNSAGALFSNFAMVQNAGDILNDGVIDNCNNFVGFFGSSITNNNLFSQGANGTLELQAGALFLNLGTISNSGSIENALGGQILNENIINNNSNGTINNLGGIVSKEFGNAGVLNNFGDLQNTGLFINNFGASLSNSGGIINTSCATFQQFSANPIACLAACTFLNDGILYAIGGSGMVENISGAGVILNNINEFPSPDAQCMNATITLNSSGEASIALGDIDDGSSASYCGIANQVLSETIFDCSDIGENVVTLTITDDLGFSDFCTATVTVLDAEIPEFTFCPDNVVINLASGECEKIAEWVNPAATDNCSFSIFRTDGSGLNSGDVFPIGITNIKYTVDDNVNEAVCSFDIVINEFVPASTSLTCLGGIIHATVDDNCQTVILPNDILVGNHYHCFDDYSVLLFYDEEMTEPVSTSPILTSQDIGQIITVMVNDTEADVSCWARVRAEDKTDPEIFCENITINCFSDPNPTAIGFPASFDNCDNGLFPTFADFVTELDCNITQENITRIITRNWTVTDFSGNSNNCVQTITVERPDLSTLEFPANFDGIENDALSCAADPNTDPATTGYPTILGVMIDNDECQFSALFEDLTIPICDGTYKIIRNWTIYDWCTGASATDQQIIKVVDHQGPVLNCPDNQTISTSSNSCTGAVILPNVEISDACSNNFNISTTTTEGTLSGNALIGLPIGTTTVTYIVEDDCNNPSTCSFEIIVEDQIPPIPVCESFHTVALTVDEPSLVNAIVFDDGSIDNCSALTFEVRRMDNAVCDGLDATSYSDKVPFYCCDVNSTVMVELRIKDASNNTNSCMVEVIVQDKLDPLITCPSSAWLDCYDDVTDLSLTNGEAIAYDNCGVSIDYSDNGGLDNCGGGTVVRTWTATDPGGRTAACFQYIVVDNSTPFFITDTDCFNTNSNDGVIWPCDYEGDVCASLTDPSTTGEPVIIEDGCDLISLTYEDTELPIIDDACVKIIRTWKVVDWCQHDYTTGMGEWTYNQLIKILNTQAPEFTSDCVDQSFCSYDVNCYDGFAELMVTANDDCTPETDLRYSYEIDIHKDGSVDYSGESANASGDYPLGQHLITWRVEDGCGNYNLCEFDFVISDCKKPTPYCINGLAIELMPNNNEVAVWASDFNQGSFDNCGIEEFRIAFPSGGPGQTVPPTSDNVVFSCGDVGTQSVDMWVKDVHGNWDYCSTYVIVQDNNVSCDEQSSEGAMITGEIQNEAGAMVESVMIYLGGTAPGIPDPNMTDFDGVYSFPSLPTGYGYQIAPAKNNDPLNGVSTFDLVIMKRHILGIEDLNSPYKMIASDINDNGSISTFDLVLLRRMILQIDAEFSNNSSWRFINADFVFPNPLNPWETPFPEVYDISNLSGDMQGDFIAVKIGDVNGNAVTNGFSGSGDDRNTEHPMLFTAKDEKLNPGRTHQIDLRASDLNKIYGYQYTLNFDTERLKFINIIPGSLPGLELGNFGFTKLAEGSITTSWDRSIDMGEFASDAILFSLIFEAQEQTSWSEVLRISSEYTRAEAYHMDLGLLNVELAFQEPVSLTNRFEIYPNQPNPFINETLISFTLPEATLLNFTIQNVSGQIVQRMDIEAKEGYNELFIDRSMLEGPGVYFYTVKTKTHRVSQRMILIRE
jgi:hypothetical protein